MKMIAMAISILAAVGLINAIQGRAANQEILRSHVAKTLVLQGGSSSGESLDLAHLDREINSLADSLESLRRHFLGLIGTQETGQYEQSITEHMMMLQSLQQQLDDLIAHIESSHHNRPDKNFSKNRYILSSHIPFQTSPNAPCSEMRIDDLI